MLGFNLMFKDFRRRNGLQSNNSSFVPRDYGGSIVMLFANSFGEYQVSVHIAEISFSRCYILSTTPSLLPTRGRTSRRQHHTTSHHLSVLLHFYPESRSSSEVASCCSKVAQWLAREVVSLTHPCAAVDQ